MRIIILFILLLSVCSIFNKEKESILMKEEEEIVKEFIQGFFDYIWGGVDFIVIVKYYMEDYIILEYGEVWDNGWIKVYI